MDSNMYRVGDQVYFEISQSPIRRIEELIEQANDQVEAKVTCFFRRRDISNSLITLADKHNIALEEEQKLEAESLNEKQKHQLKHRELFFSRQVGTLSSTQIRGKCNVSLLNELESLSSYLNKDDSFFYTLVYEPNQKTLLADRDEIRVGQRYQAEVPQKMPEQPELDLNKRYETLVFTNDDRLMETEINHYLTIVKLFGDICLLQNESTNETKSDDGFEFMRASPSFNVSFSQSESPRPKRKKYEHSLSTIDSKFLDRLDESNSLNSLVNNTGVLENIKHDLEITKDLKIQMNECLSHCYNSHGFPGPNKNEVLLSGYVFLILSHVIDDFNKRFKTEAYIHSQEEIISSNKLFGGSFDYAISTSKNEYKVQETIIFFECKLKCIYEALTQCRGYLKIAAEIDRHKPRYAIGLTGFDWLLLKDVRNSQSLYRGGMFLNPSLIINKKMFLGNSIFVDFIYQILADHYRISLDS